MEIVTKNFALNLSSGYAKTNLKTLTMLICSCQFGVAIQSGMFPLLLQFGPVWARNGNQLNTKSWTAKDIDFACYM